MRCWLEILDQPKLIGAAGTMVLDGIHALANEVQAEATGLDFVEATTAEFGGVDLRAIVTQQNLQTGALGGRAAGHPGAVDLNGLIELAVITVTHDVGQRFVDRAGDGATVRRRKAENLSEAFERAPHDAEQFRVALQFQLQQKSVIGSGAYALCITLTHKKKTTIPLAA